MLCILTITTAFLIATRNKLFLNFSINFKNYNIFFNSFNYYLFMHYNYNYNLILFII